MNGIRARYRDEPLRPYLGLIRWRAIAYWLSMFTVGGISLAAALLS